MLQPCRMPLKRGKGLLKISAWNKSGSLRVKFQAAGQELFKETAGDISFALHNLELEKERAQAEDKIKAQNEAIQVQLYEIEQANIELKQAQKKLLNSNQIIRESEEKYRNLIENAGVPIIYFARNGRILTINAIAAKNLKGEPSNYIGKSIYDLFPKVADGIMERLREVIRTESIKEYEDFFELPIGKFWFLTDMYPVKDSSGKTFAVQVIARDITEQKRAREALSLAEEKLRLIFDSIKDGITISDLEGNIIDSNQEGLRRHGFKSIDELKGMKGFDFISERDREKAVKDMENALSDESSAHLVEYNLKGPDGGEIPVEATAALLRDSSGNPIAFINVTRDITERRKAEEAVRKSEERFHALLDKSSDGIAVINADGTFSYEGPVNDRILGYTADDTVLTSIFDTIHPDDQSSLSEDFARLIKKSGDTITGTYRARHKDGSWRTIEAVARNLMDDPIVKGIVVNFRDVTERQQAEEAVKASEQKFREIFNNVNDEIMYIDSAGNVINVNRRVEDIFGYEPQEVIGRNFAEFGSVFGEDIERIAKMFSEVIASGETRLIELKGKRKDGSTVYVEVSPSIIKNNSDIEGMLIVVRDITERKQAEELFATLATNSQIGSYIIQDGVFRFANPVFLRDLGLTEEDLIGKTPIDIVHPDDRERVRQEAIKMLKGENKFGYEFKAIDRHGNVRHAYEKVTSIEYQGKRAVLGSYMDITEKKRTEEKLDQYRVELEQRLGELQEAYEKLQGMDKLKDKFLSTVSHELRTPLTSIKSFTEILLTYDNDRETQKEFLNTINDESDRLTRLINDFLDISKIESGRLQWENTLVKVLDIIKSAVESAEPVAAKTKLTVTIESELDLPLVLVDRDRLTQVITNLLDNAIKFTPEEGRITIKSELMKSRKSPTEPDMIKVSIIDTGIGIAPEDQGRVFEKFAQINSGLVAKPKGTGLGLTISREIVEHFGGTIWVESELGKGSTFAFTIPVPEKSEANTIITKKTSIYELCRAMKTREVLTFRDYVTRQDLPEKYVILRHDVDRKPGNALRMAKLEHELGIQSTYYFRMKPHTFKPDIIRQIADMGHEIGYHYETLDKAKGDPKRAIDIFDAELGEFRTVCTVDTICAHGNPLTKWNNESIWDQYSYSVYGISGEAFSVQDNKICYFTDTGRTWNWKYRRKDIVSNALGDDAEVVGTDDLIDFISRGNTDIIYIGAHPERWNDGIFGWSARLLEDKAMNIGKRLVFAFR